MAEANLAVLVGEAVCSAAAAWTAHLGRPDLCISLTRVTLEVCRHFKVAAKPILVEAACYNAEFIAEVEGGNMDPLTNPKAWSTAAGVRPPAPTEFWGHLVTIATGPKPRLIDASAGQLARPEHDIHARAFHADIPSTLLATPWAFPLRDGGAARYVRVQAGAAEQERLYRSAPDWQVSDNHRGLIAAVIEAVDRSGGDPANIGTVEAHVD